MNSLFRSKTRRSRVFRLVQMMFAAMFITFAISVPAQQPQLTLADILIGLRSKKVTIEERNTILAAAVRERGITFGLTPEIEKELAATGASRVLLDAVKEKSPAPAPAATPVPTPTPDFVFFKTRADASLGKGEYALALSDYDKAVTLKPDNAVAFLNRGRTHYSLKDFPKASADFNKAIELDPKDAKAYYSRGLLHESLGELDKALADYQRAADLDPSNEAAKAMVKKINDQLQAKAAEKLPVPEPAKPEPVPVKAPESMNLGALTAANAVRMIKPVFPPTAQRSNIEGKVTVEVSLDVEGNVVSAKAVSGHQFLRGAAEDAAKRSKFRPAMFNGQPIKATGSITYNFTLRPTSEEED